MSDMAKKRTAETVVFDQPMLFEELIDDSPELFPWSNDVHDQSIHLVPPAQVVQRQGSEPEDLIEIVSGTLKLSQVTEDGRQIILGFPSAGEIIGLTGAQECRHAAETLTVTQLRLIRRKEFYRRVLQRRAVREQLLGWFDAHEKMMQDHIAILSLQNPMAKLAAFLLKQHALQAKGRQDHITIDLPMTQSDIATYLAIAPETCSRKMKKLRQETIIEAGVRRGSGKLLRILDRERLVEFANGPVF